MGSRRDAASVIFNLPGYRVIDAVDLPLGGRRVKVEAGRLGRAAAQGVGWCRPGCMPGSVQRVRDVPHAGRVEVVVRKPRLVCAEPACRRRTFTHTTTQLPTRARCTTRLRTAALAAVIDSGRAVAEVAGEFGVAWWTVQATVNAAAVLLPDVDELWVRRLGIDEHRYRRVRWFRDESGGWRRVEPWMSTIVNADTGQVLGIVDGRDSAAVGGWLAARSPAWRARIQVVAIDPSAAFRRAIRRAAAGRVDQRRPVPSGAAGEPDGDPGTAAAGPGTRTPPRAEDRPGVGAPDSAAPRLRHPVRPGRAKLQTVFDLDDPTDELSAAWGVKEQLRRLLKATSVEQARHEKLIFTRYVLAADMVETWRLWATIDAWWPAIEVLITHRRHQRPHRGSEHRHQADQANRAGLSQSTPLPSPYPAPQRRPTRGVNTLTSQGTTVKCE